jgi:hypothetical protein
MLTHACVAELLPGRIRGKTHELWPVRKRYIYDCDVIKGRFVYIKRKTSRRRCALQAHDYYMGSPSPNWALLLNDVVMGKTVKLTKQNQSLTKVRRLIL